MADLGADVTYNKNIYSKNSYLKKFKRLQMMYNILLNLKVYLHNIWNKRKRSKSIDNYNVYKRKS